MGSTVPAPCCEPYREHAPAAPDSSITEYNIMADIAPIPFVNFGASQAQQGQATAATNLMNTQAVGAGIQNQSEALQLQATKLGLQMLYHMPGFGAAQAAQSDMTSRTDSSGVGDGGASPGVGGGGASPGVGGGGASPGVGGGGAGATGPASLDEDVGMSAFQQPGQLDAQLRKDFQINPLGTPEEQQNVMKMAYVSALTKNPAYANMAVQQRDYAVAQRKFQAQQQASVYYDNMSAVADGGDKGMAFQLMQKAAPSAAATLQAAHPDATVDQMNELAADTASHFGAHIHQWTGREAEKRDDGVYVDSQTKFPVAGVRGSGMTPEKYADQIDKANALVPGLKDSAGHDINMSVWEYAKSQGMPVQSANDYVRYMQDQQQFLAQHQQGVRDLQTAAATARGQPTPGTPGGPPMLPPSAQGAPGAGAPGAAPGGLPMQPGTPGGPPMLPPSAQGAPGAGAPGAAPGGLPMQPGQQTSGPPAPGAVGAPGAAPGAPGAAPGAPGAQRSDNGLLPGVNPDALPKIQVPPTRMGVSQSPAEAAQAMALVTERNAQLKDSNTQYVEAQKSGALIRAAQREAATLQNNPRMVGPGSELAQGIAKIKTAVTGQPPDALVDLGSLDKILLQMGAQNIRQALSGQRITNQEFMTMLSRGNPNTEQPLATIQRLLGYYGAQNDYDQRFAKTKQMALNRGADPFSVDTAIGGVADRGDYVEGKVGVRPPLPGGGGGSASGVTQISNAADYTNIAPGAQYRDPQGNLRTKPGAK
jgi:hypothetical protein